MAKRGGLDGVGQGRQDGQNRAADGVRIPLSAGRLLRYAGKRRKRHKGHASPGLLAFSTMGVQVMFVAGGTDRGSVDLLGWDASGSQLQRIGGEQVHGPALRAVGDEELLPGRELVLKRSDGA